MTTARTTNSTALGQLDFLTALFRPLLRIEEAAFLLDDLSADHVSHLVDEGMLRAINIAARTDTRRSLRIYRHSVERLVIPALAKVQGEPSIEDILPHSRPHLLRPEVAHLLGCDERHVANLALEGPRFGIGRTSVAQRNPRIYRTALIEFLTAREIQD